MMEEARDAYRILVGKLFEKFPLGSSRRQDVGGTDSELCPMADFDISRPDAMVIQKGANKPQIAWFSG
jgi:hypothetical protein